jgi:hypothetical protein
VVVLPVLHEGIAGILVSQPQIVAFIRSCITRISSQVNVLLSEGIIKPGRIAVSLDFKAGNAALTGNELGSEVLEVLNLVKLTAK